MEYTELQCSILNDDIPLSSISHHELTTLLVKAEDWDNDYYGIYIVYTDEERKTMTFAIERIIKQHLEDSGVSKGIPKKVNCKQGNIQNGGLLSLRKYLSTPGLREVRIFYLPSIHIKYNIVKTGNSLKNRKDCKIYRKNKPLKICLSL